MCWLNLVCPVTALGLAEYNLNGVEASYSTANVIVKVRKVNFGLLQTF